MPLIPAEEYVAMRTRELAGERGVFFPEPETHAAVVDDMADELERFPILPPRIRRRA
jgi:hypothetical protein